MCASWNIVIGSGANYGNNKYRFKSVAPGCEIKVDKSKHRFKSVAPDRGIKVDRSKTLF